MLRDRLFSTTVHFMAPEGVAADAGGGGGTPVAPAGDKAPGGEAPVAAAVEAAPASDASTAGGESATHESSPSLLSSAAGKETPEKPAPAADAKPEPDAEAADAPESKKDGEPAAKPDDPGKATKPEDKAAAATDPAGKDATPAAAPAPVSLEDLKLPEGAKLDPEGGKAFVEILNNADLSGKDRGQALIDLHQKEITRVHKELTDHQRKVWDDLNAGWKDQLRKDPELGGNRLDTTLSRAKAVVEEFLSPDDAKALLIHTDNNGMGNFPVFIRLLNAIGQRFNVFEDFSVASNPKTPSAKGPGNRGWYDKSLNAQGA